MASPGLALAGLGRSGWHRARRPPSLRSEMSKKLVFLTRNHSTMCKSSVWSAEHCAESVSQETASPSVESGGGELAACGGHIV